MKSLIVLFAAVLNVSLSMAQEKILVSEGSIKIAGFGEENLYFGFAADDRIVKEKQIFADPEISRTEVPVIIK